MVPVSWLSCRLRWVRLVRSPSCAGMVPVSWLPSRRSSFRLVMSPSSSGMVPVRVLRVPV